MGPKRKETFPKGEERDTLGGEGKLTKGRLAALLLSPSAEQGERDSPLNQGDQEIGDKWARIGHKTTTSGDKKCQLETRGFGGPKELPGAIRKGAKILPGVIPPKGRQLVTTDV